MILLIDNYDSFVYNLARYVGDLGHAREVYRNDQITLDEIARKHPSHIILSPGPCTPNEAGICLAVIERFAQQIPILGICLGHQAIGQVFGGHVVKAKRPLHGMSALIRHDQSRLFEGLNNPLQAGRYHSLVIAPESLPDVLQVTAWSDEHEIMGLQHASLPIYGVQFHPESVLTPEGHQLIGNFLA